MKVKIGILLCSWENTVTCGIGLSALIFSSSRHIKLYNQLAIQEIVILVQIFVMYEYLYSTVIHHLSSWKGKKKHLFLELTM
jgi:hypothetical protein